MDRPIRPEPAEFPRIKRAMRAARFMKWGATPVAGVAAIVSIIVGASTTWYFGVLPFLVLWSAVFLIGYSLARCPHCGQVWWSGMGTLAVAPWWFAATESAAQEDETESFVCRRCRIDIG
jgi:hypothetical protein